VRSPPQQGSTHRDERIYRHGHGSLARLRSSSRRHDCAIQFLGDATRRLNHTTVMSCDMIVANSGGLSGAIGHALLKRERYGA